MIALAGGCRAHASRSDSSPPAASTTSADGAKSASSTAASAQTLPRWCDPLDVGHDGSRVRVGEARRLAARAGNHYLGESVLVSEQARRFGWEFTFVSRRYHETQDPNLGQPGAGPIAIHRDSGTACMLPGFPGAVDEYERQWLALRDAATNG